MGKADLHIHTRESDGLGTVAQVLEHVERRTDLDVIAITDHEEARGGHVARELSAQRGYRAEVIIGAEVTTLQGHLLALFIERCPKSFRGVERTIEDIHAQGGLAVIPHPMSWLTRSLSERTIARLMTTSGPGTGFDGIESHNPSLAGKVTSRRAARLNLLWGLPETGGSDAHHLAHIATGWTEFAGTTAEDLRLALLAGTTKGASTRYPSVREVGPGRIALGLAWGYSATPRKMLRLPGRSRSSP